MQVNSDIIDMASIVYESDRCVDKRASYLDHGRAKLSEVSTIDSTNWDELKLATALKLICYPEEDVETGDSEEVNCNVQMYFQLLAVHVMKISHGK
jgi:nucleolar protein 58